MHVTQPAFLCLFLAPFLTIAQTDNRKDTVSWKLTIAGRNDSITTDEILSDGKLECHTKLTTRYISGHKRPFLTVFRSFAAFEIFFRS